MTLSTTAKWQIPRQWTGSALAPSDEATRDRSGGPWLAASARLGAASVALVLAATTIRIPALGCALPQPPAAHVAAWLGVAGSRAPSSLAGRRRRRATSSSTCSWSASPSRTAWTSRTAAATCDRA
jgi:hypothetical protein